MSEMRLSSLMVHCTQISGVWISSHMNLLTSNVLCHMRCVLVFCIYIVGLFFYMWSMAKVRNQPQSIAGHVIISQCTTEILDCHALSGMNYPTINYL
jgi:hypothetical protein